MHLNGFLGHIGDMMAGVVVQQKNSMLPDRSFFIVVLSLLNIEFRVDRLFSFRQFEIDNPFTVPSYAQRGVSGLPGLSYSLRCSILTYRHHCFSPVAIR